jgi:TrmH family RNA methyltransferase
MREPVRITSPRNDHIKRWKKLLTRKGRERCGTLLVEGEHLIREAFAAGLPFESVMVREDMLADWRELAEEVSGGSSVYVLAPVLFDEIADTETPQGIAAEVKSPLRTGGMPAGDRLTCTYLLLDKIQDPGNLGTILRTALAAGVDAVWLGKGTVDPFNGKALRSAMGAAFRLPMVQENLSEAIPRMKEQGITVVGTSPHAGFWHFEYDYPDRVAILLGNEGQGVDPALAALADANVRIPMPGGTESLNVSVTGAILVYERIRQQYRRL